MSKRDWGISALEGIPKEKIEVIQGKVPSKSNLNKIFHFQSSTYNRWPPYNLGKESKKTETKILN